MSSVILYGFAPSLLSEIVLLLHRVAQRAPNLAPSDITRVGEVLQLEYEPSSEDPQPIARLNLAREAERTVVTLESSGSEGIDRRAQTLIHRVLRIARGEE